MQFENSFLKNNFWTP